MCRGYYDRRFGDEESFNLALNLLDKTTCYETAIMEIIGDCYIMGLGVEKMRPKQQNITKKPIS